MLRSWAKSERFIFEIHRVFNHATHSSLHSIRSSRAFSPRCLRLNTANWRVPWQQPSKYANSTAFVICEEQVSGSLLGISRRSLILILSVMKREQSFLVIFRGQPRLLKGEAAQRFARSLSIGCPGSRDFDELSEIQVGVAAENLGLNTNITFDCCFCQNSVSVVGRFQSGNEPEKKNIFKITSRHAFVV